MWLYNIGCRFRSFFSAPSDVACNPAKKLFSYNIESSLLSSLTINVFSKFLFFSDVKTESESENIIFFLCLSLEMMLKARSIAHTSAVKMELFIGRAFL